MNRLSLYAIQIVLTTSKKKKYCVKWPWSMIEAVTVIQVRAGGG